MIEWLKSWTNQIMVAVIIAVIFELIIPNGKNKKYIKMVINLYVLFVILNPIISKLINGKELDGFQYNYEKYFNNTNMIETSSNLNSNDMIKNTVEKKIKEDIKSKLASEGYNVTDISIDINNSDSKYGQINSIKLTIQKDVGKDSVSPGQSSNLPLQSKNSSVVINKVEEINITNETDKKKNTLRKSEIEKVKKIISKEYSVSMENIEIN